MQAIQKVEFVQGVELRDGGNKPKFHLQMRLRLLE